MARVHSPVGGRISARLKGVARHVAAGRQPGPSQRPGLVHQLAVGGQQGHLDAGADGSVTLTWDAGGWRNGAARHEHGPGTTRKPDTPGGLPQLRWQQPGQCELIRNPRGSSGDSDRLLPKGSPVRPPSTDPAGQTWNHPLNHDGPQARPLRDRSRTPVNRPFNLSGSPANPRSVATARKTRHTVIHGHSVGRAGPKHRPGSGRKNAGECVKRPRQQPAGRRHSLPEDRTG